MLCQSTRCSHAESSRMCMVMQEWPELGGGVVSTVHHAASLTQDPMTSSAASATTPRTNGQVSEANEASPLGPSTTASTSGSPATASVSSPDQRLPATPSPAPSHRHSPETLTSGHTTAGSSPAAAPHALLQQQQRQAPLPAHHSCAAAAVPSNELPSPAPAQAQQTVLQQQQLQSRLPAAAVQRDPVVQLVSRRSSGRVPPPGFSAPRASSTSSALSSHETCQKVHHTYTLGQLLLVIVSRLQHDSSKPLLCTLRILLDTES